MREEAEGLDFFTLKRGEYLERKPQGSCDRGTAVIRFLDHLYSPDWQKSTDVCYIGDDSTDEDALRTLMGKAISMKIFVDSVQSCCES